MDFRLATEADLLPLKLMYEKLIDHMNKNNIQIWNEIYPYEFFQDDIDNKRLYVLTENENIAGAFALCTENEGEKYIKWDHEQKDALYIDRLGINVNYLRQGIGGQILDKAKALAKMRNARHLRLFVVDINEPAINLYLKNGFIRSDGVYEEKIEDYVLTQYGFTARL